MARAKITAPANPAVAQAARLRVLAAKGAKRTPAEASEALDLLAARVAELEARLNIQG
jgi:hypothetical protein